MLLVAVDPAGCAERVVAEACRLALDLDESLTLSTAVDLPEGVDRDVAVEAGMFAGRTAEQVLREDALRALEILAGPVREQGVEVLTEVRTGHPVEVILAAVADHRPRLVVVGTHGRTGLKRFFLGSVAEQVVRRADRPVLTVRATEGTVDHPSDAQQVVAALADG